MEMKLKLKLKLKLSVSLVVAVMASSMAVAQQDGGTSCVQGLIPCANYVNTTGKPPATCCDPLKDVISKQKACLCSLLNNTSLIESFHINISQALALPSRCDIPGVSTNACSNSSAPTPGSSTTPSSKGSSNTTSSGKDSSVGSRNLVFSAETTLIFVASAMLGALPLT